jgi:hypothetical protein
MFNTKSGVELHICTVILIKKVLWEGYSFRRREGGGIDQASTGYVLPASILG